MHARIQHSTLDVATLYWEFVEAVHGVEPHLLSVIMDIQR